MNALSPVMRRDLVCRAVSVARYSPNANAYGTPGAWENVGRLQAQFAW
jgi:hypothetical protein